MDSLCWRELYHLIAQEWIGTFWPSCGFPFWWRWWRYRIQALIFATSIRCHNIFRYQSFVLHGVWYNDSNISAKSTPPMLLLYCPTMWGHGIFFFTFSFSHHLSNSSFGSTSTKLEARLTTVLSTHFTYIIPKLLLQR